MGAAAASKAIRDDTPRSCVHIEQRAHDDGGEACLRKSYGDQHQGHMVIALGPVDSKAVDVFPTCLRPLDDKSKVCRKDLSRGVEMNTMAG